MKAFKISVAALALTMTSTVYAQTADDIINKHIDAVGGTKAWDKVKSIKMVGSMSAQGMEISVSQTIVNDKGFRTDISAMGQNGYMIITPTGGWTYMPFAGQTEPMELKAEDVKPMKGQLNYKNSQLVDKSQIAKAQMDGKDTIDSKPCTKLKVTDKEGGETEYYFDDKTYYIVRMEKKMKVGEEEQEMAVTYSDFKKQPEGIVVPMKVSQAQGDVTFKSVEINKPVDEKIFKPGS